MATVPVSTRTTTYTLASVSPGPFLVGFRIFDDTLTVYVNDEPTEGYILTSAYVDGYDDNASILLDVPLEIGDVLRIDGDMPLSRAADYINPDPNLTGKINIEQARIWAGMQQIKRQSDRSMMQSSEVRDAILAVEATAADAVQFTNYSTPQEMDPVVLYVTSDGVDPGMDLINAGHGTTLETAFATWEAALEHVKLRYRFAGRLNTVELRFGPGSWGFFSLGSNLEQAQDFYPFAIVVTCADPLDWPRFNGITNGSFSGATLVYAKNVEAGYFVATRRNTTIIQDVRVWNYGGLAYCLYANVGGMLYAFGDIDVLEPCSYSSAFVMAQQGGRISLENGDVPLIFPQVNIINPGNITSPHKYRIVLDAFLWVSTNVYPQMTYASKFWRDTTSVSPQDNEDNAFKLVGTNTGTSGYERYDNGRVEQWGTFTVSSAPSGETLNFGTLNFPFAMPNGTYIIEFHTNTPRIMVTRESGSSASACPYSVRNIHTAAADATVYWRVIGYI